ncbi:MAG: PqqD family protein [Gammaproteobacteria bacterium]|nr:PqqD family protein [Gammaproteobacteria bacterium]
MPYHVPDRLLLQAVADEKVILDPDSGTYYTLDAVGSRMIDLLRETGSLEQAVAGIVEEYEVDELTALDHLTELLEQMAQHGLVQKTGG